MVPLVDAQPYDLVVDGPDGLQRVQVETTTYHTSKPFDPSASDLL